MRAAERARNGVMESPGEGKKEQVIGFVMLWASLDEKIEAGEKKGSTLDRQKFQGLF